MATISANDAGTALAEHIAGSESAFVRMMNEKAEELGLANTNFVNSTASMPPTTICRPGTYYPDQGDSGKVPEILEYTAIKFVRMEREPAMCARDILICPPPLPT